MVRLGSRSKVWLSMVMRRVVTLVSLSTQSPQTGGEEEEGEEEEG